MKISESLLITNYMNRVYRSSYFHSRVICVIWEDILLQLFSIVHVCHTDASQCYENILKIYKSYKLLWILGNLYLKYPKESLNSNMPEASIHAWTLSFLKLYAFCSFMLWSTYVHLRNRVNILWVKDSVGYMQFKYTGVMRDWCYCILW